MFHLLPLSRREVEGRPDLPLPWEAARTPAAAAAERFAYGALWETFLRGGYPEPSTYPDALMSFKDRVASDLAQHLAHVGEPIRGPAEQLRSLTDVHRGVACHSADRKLELTDLLGNGPEVDLASCGGGGVGGCRHDVSD